MASITAQYNGNWSDTSTWVGGVVPVDGDTVDAAGREIIFDVDIDQPNTLLTSTGWGYYRHAGSGTRTVRAQANAGSHLYESLIHHTGSGALVFDGEVTGGEGAYAFGVHSTGSGDVHVTTATGGSGDYSIGVYSEGSGDVHVTTATGGSGDYSIGAAIGGPSGGAYTVVTAIGGTGHEASGVYTESENGTPVVVRRMVSGPGGEPAVYGRVLLEGHPDNSAEFRLAVNGATKTLAPAAPPADYPAEADVRAGVTYADGTYTGLLIPLVISDGAVQRAAPALDNFYPGTTKQFVVVITFNGSTPDITSDTVTFTMKRIPALSDAQAAIISIADVSSGGTEGKAIFTLTPADTAVAPGTYHYDIVWQRHGGGEYVLARNVVWVLDRVSDL